MINLFFYLNLYIALIKLSQFLKFTQNLIYLIILNQKI